MSIHAYMHTCMYGHACLEFEYGRMCNFVINGYMHTCLEIQCNRMTTFVLESAHFLDLKLAKCFFAWHWLKNLLDCRYHYNVADSRLRQHIDKGNEDGLHISCVASSTNLWALIMDAGTGFTAQVYELSAVFLHKVVIQKVLVTIIFC